jgi:hypothetical protein
MLIVSMFTKISYLLQKVAALTQYSCTKTHILYMLVQTNYFFLLTYMNKKNSKKNKIQNYLPYMTSRS